MKQILIACLMVIFVAAQLYIPHVSYAQSTPSSWAADEVMAAMDEQLVTESVSADFQANITREQFCELVILAYEKISGHTAALGSVSFDDTANTEVLKAAALGIVNGYGNGIFAPHELITREQMATMLVRMIDKAVPQANVTKYTTHFFADIDLISDWALPSVNFVFDKGIMRGVDNNFIVPKANTTCEQAVLLLYRVAERYYDEDTSLDSIYELPLERIAMEIRPANPLEFYKTTRYGCRA